MDIHRPVAGVLIVVATACSRSPSGRCTFEAESGGLTVVVKDGASGRLLCDAAVLASGDAGSFPLMPGGDATSCAYFGLAGELGTFDVIVGRDGYSARELSVTLGEDACGQPVAENRSVELDALADAGLDAE